MNDRYNLDLLTNIDKMTPAHMHNEIDRAIQKTIEKQIIRLNFCLIDFVNQLYLDTATWGLIYWERLVALDTDYNFSLEIRRSRIKTRLRSKGITTVNTIKSIAEAFSNGICEIEENYSNFSFLIKFISTIGIPERIDEVENAINAIKPAHLDFKFEFKYITWGDTKKAGLSADFYKNKGYTWEDIRNGKN